MNILFDIMPVDAPYCKCISLLIHSTHNNHGINHSNSKRSISVYLFCLVDLRTGGDEAFILPFEPLFFDATRFAGGVVSSAFLFDSGGTSAFRL